MIGRVPWQAQKNNMMRAIPTGCRRTVAPISVALLLLAGCGGGGGGGGGGAQVPEGTSVSFSTSSLTARAGYNDQAPILTVHMTVAHTPRAGLFVRDSLTKNGIETVTLHQISTSEADILVGFRAPARQ